MRRHILLAALLSPGMAGAADCALPATLDQRRFINLSDPLYAADNPNAGRMVHVSFGHTAYTLDVLGTDVRIGGNYRYRRLAPHVAEIQMSEAHSAGPARYSLLLTCLTDSQGRFIYTQHDGPIAPRQRQNSGRWTLQPQARKPTPVKWRVTRPGNSIHAWRGSTGRQPWQGSNVSTKVDTLRPPQPEQPAVAVAAAGAGRSPASTPSPH
ncbi:hypothetical protein [Stenotrophomonas sp. NPDC077659]|uniref:hypothetical protein n=1 Tax=Stenotrophomonas sp. NPDC077659 TaxID=3390694 RepID=UPI003D006500